MSFFSTSLFEEIKVELFRHSFFLFVHGRAVLAMEGKSVLPVHSAILSEKEEALYSAK